MSRTVSFFLSHLEKRQTLLKSLTTLKTDNSRLKELISSKSEQVKEMNMQLESVSHVEKDLRELISSLFAKIDYLKTTYTTVQSRITSQSTRLSQLNDQIITSNQQLQQQEEEKSNIRKLLQSLQNEKMVLSTSLQHACDVVNEQTKAIGNDVILISLSISHTINMILSLFILSRLSLFVETANSQLSATRRTVEKEGQHLQQFTHTTEKLGKYAS